MSQDAPKWVLAVARRIDLGETPTKRATVALTTFGRLIDLHIGDMQEVGKAPRRSKAASLEVLREKLGTEKLKDLTRERPTQFGRIAPRPVRSRSLSAAISTTSSW